MVFCDISDVKIHGRLGNCLFKIAATLALAKKHNVESKFSTWEYDIFDKINFNSNKSNLIIKNSYIEPFFKYKEIQYAEGLELIGYFQSEKYFNEYRDYIIDCFQFKEKIERYILEKYGNIFENSCSVHVRRGDYLLLKGNYEVLGLSYYEKAISAMKQNGVEKFIIFSDDIEWCKKNIKTENSLFIEKEKDYIDLALMTKCENNIIANSSFSWWGAWLNKNNNKKIIAPNNWFGEKLLIHDTKDLIPNDWHKI